MFAQELFLAYLYAKYNGMSANAISVFQVKRVKLPHLLMLSRHAFEQRWSGCYKLSRSGLCLSPWSFIWWPWLFGYLHLVPIWMLQGHEKNQVHYRKSDDSWSGNESPIIMASGGRWKTWGEKERKRTVLVSMGVYVQSVHLCRTYYFPLVFHYEMKVTMRVEMENSSPQHALLQMGLCQTCFVKSKSNLGNCFETRLRLLQVWNLNMLIIPPQRWWYLLGGV